MWMNKVRTILRQLLGVTLFVTVLWAYVGCCFCFDNDNGPAEGTTPVSQDLPVFELRDDTPDILITWIDEKGEYHVVGKTADVPENAREIVRIVTVEHGHGDLLYVADLRSKSANGVYPVKTMPRSGWELIAKQRRDKAIAALSPTATTSGLSTAVPTAPIAPPSARLSAIVYSTSWCGVCRNAESYLRKQGATVVVKDIEKSNGARTEMNEKLRKAGLKQDGSVPVIDIRGKIFKGFDKRGIDRAIKDSTRGDVL